MVGVTGANGYVGGRILAHLRATGVGAVALVRRPDGVQDSDTARARRFALGEPLAADALEGVDCVVHAAYDLTARGKGVREVNYDGSLPLLEAAHERGVPVVLISSLAAFDGARSVYGRLKRDLERAVAERGGYAVRCGVVFGAGAGGLFGSLVSSLSKATVTPMIGGGRQRLFVTHDGALCALVAALASGSAPDLAEAPPIFAAHEQPTCLREIAAQIAEAHGHGLRTVFLPAPAVIAGLRGAELAGFRLAFRSDSVVSLAHPIPLDEVAAMVRGPVEFPALSAGLWRV